VGVPVRRLNALLLLFVVTLATLLPIGPAAASSHGLADLDPALARYAAALGNEAGVSVHDLTHRQWYGSRSASPFITASSIKVAIMLAVLRKDEAHGRPPSSQECTLLRAMIEHSDNDAASTLYERVGGQAGMQRFANQIGLRGFAPADAATRGWGWSTITPRAMATLLTWVWRHRIVNDADRALALRLMSHVESDQRWGVGTTAPPEAFVAMKNGWVPGPDGLWAVNSSGIVSTSRATYVVATYTAHDSSFSAGQEVVIHVSRAVANVLD
jgi:beta-lactamase class A